MLGIPAMSSHALPATTESTSGSTNRLTPTKNSMDKLLSITKGTGNIYSTTRLYGVCLKMGCAKVIVTGKLWENEDRSWDLRVFYFETNPCD
jgi:hypothetical protein